MNLNRVILIGRLAADPESRTTAGGQSVASMRIVTNRVWKDQSGPKQEQAEFHSITLWGRLAQIATQYLKKGGLVMVEGRLQTRSWTGQDNVKKYRTEIVADRVQFGPKRAGSGFSGNVPVSGGTQEVMGGAGPGESEDSDTIDYPTEEIKAEDIPF